MLYVTMCHTVLWGAFLLGQQLCYGVYGLSLLLGVLFLAIPEDQKSTSYITKQVLEKGLIYPALKGGDCS